MKCGILSLTKFGINFLTVVNCHSVIKRIGSSKPTATVTREKVVTAAVRYLNIVLSNIYNILIGRIISGNSKFPKVLSKITAQVG
jgi:hypothetical protein